MTLPNRVKLVEVGPRDGLQNEPQTLPTPLKIDFIERLAQTGLPVVEATSFVSPKKIPQTADNAEVLAGLTRVEGVEYPVLVPNLQGYHAAIKAGATSIAIFTATTNSFTQHNINCSIEASFERFAPVMAEAKKANIKVRGYLSCCLGCPYEGDVSPDTVATLATRLKDLGCEEISLGDTIGIGTPLQAKQMIRVVSEQVPVKHLAAHFHDTYGQALANLYAVMELGIATIDASVAGIGGCPYAPSAAGNVATEDVVYMLQGMGIQTGVDLNALIQCGQFICEHLGRPYAHPLLK